MLSVRSRPTGGCDRAAPGVETVSHISRASLFGKLNSLAYKSVERATDLCKRRGNPYVDLEHWIHQILTLDDVNSIPPAAQDLPRRSSSSCKARKQCSLSSVQDGWMLRTEPKEWSDDPDDYVRTEIQIALDRGIAIIPILVDDVQIPAARMLPEVVKPLATRQASKVRADPDFDSDIDRLLETVNTLVGGRRNLLLSRDP